MTINYNEVVNPELANLFTLAEVFSGKIHAVISTLGVTTIEKQDVEYRNSLT